ncbi:hypothetical protein BDQ17DRAFT_126162 [Cyathus striatus]|nr:hypothetical protein BDQ17DRAFT_126162 [Cyathus striatus]
MFPRGPRFEPLKVSDGPGPNAYNVAQDPNSQSYKRGAFLEKADRFSLEKESNAPAPPDAYSTDLKKHPPKQLHSVPPANLADRYAVLQKKVQDLESVHNEQKKAHHTEVERLKQDLSRSQRLVQEKSDRLDKQKKQSEISELRIQELRKAAATDQAEVKDLRLKLRLSEHEKSQLSAKYAEIFDSTKSFQAIESKRRQDIREKDKKVADLETSIAAETRKRQLAESSLNDLKSNFNRQLDDARAEANKVQTSAHTAELNAQHAKAELEDFHRIAAEKEHYLLLQIEQCRALLASTTLEYARLSAMTVPRDSHDRLKREYNDTQFRVFRIQRKLLNTEGQVIELVHLVRQTSEQNALLKAQLQDALLEIAFLSELQSEIQLHSSDYRNDDPIYAMQDELHLYNICQLEADLYSMRSFQELYQAHSDCVNCTFSMLQEELSSALVNSEQRSQDLASALASHEVIATRLEAAQRGSTEYHEQLSAATADLAKERSTVAVLEKQLADMQNQVDGDKHLHETALKKEKDAQQRLASALQKSRIVEDALRSEIDSLTAELAHTEQYQEAYLTLSKEVQKLISRNELAEDEANKLSGANAKILGHHNPAQKIMYVDRIRKELSEAKQRILTLIQEQEYISSQNTNLRHELDMYKSVMVPTSDKPRTNLTRIGRSPLESLNRSMDLNQLDPLHGYFQDSHSNS